MKNMILFGVIAIMLTGCAAGKTDGCAYKGLVGKSAYGAEVDAVRASGKEIRLLYPDSFLGFEKKENRVNLIRDETGEILAVTCG